MIKAVAKIIVTYGKEIQDEVFKVNVGNYSVRSIVRRAKEIRPGILGYATAIINAYNDKKKKNILLADRLYGSGKNRIRKMSEDEDSAESADELLNEDDDQDIDDEEALSSI